MGEGAVAVMPRAGSGPKVGPEYYDETYWTTGETSGYVNYGPHWYIHGAIAQYLVKLLGLQRGQHVLDAGGCFGYMAARMAVDHGLDCDVVDASQYAVDNCAPELRGRVSQLDLGAERLPFANGWFHAVVSIETLEHIYEPEVKFALGELARVLRPGGLLYASIATDETGQDTPHPVDRGHQTMKPSAWWRERFAGLRELAPRPDLEENAPTVLVRGKGYSERIAAKYGWNIFVYEKGDGGHR